MEIRIQSNAKVLTGERYKNKMGWKYAWRKSKRGGGEVVIQSC